jgi:hypothetical protein
MARMAAEPSAVAGLSEADQALEAAISSSLMSPTSLENVQPASQAFTPTDKTVLGPADEALNKQFREFTPADVSQPTGVDSPEHKQLVAAAEKQLANPSITAPDPNAALSNQPARMPTVEGWSTMAAANPITAVDPNAALSAPADVASMTTDVTGPSAVDTRTDAQIAADFAQEVGAQKKGRISPQDQVRMETQMQVPALETVAVPEQPEIAPPIEDPNVALTEPTVTVPTVPTPAVAPALTQPAKNPMQSAADQVLGSAMGV